jgi:hypothetical protein
MTIKEQILQASYYAHIKAAEELARVGMMDRAEQAREEANKISLKLHKNG